MRYVTFITLLCKLLTFQFLPAQAPDTSWTKTFGGNNHDRGIAVRQTFDGGYIVAGNTRSFGSGGADIWLIKTNYNGDTLWTRTIGGNNDDSCRDIELTTDAGIIIVGTTNSFGVGGSDVWLIKTDNNGDTLWTKTYGTASNESGTSVQQTSDGGYIVLGVKSGIWLLKTDNNGDTLWTRVFHEHSIENATSVQETSDGGYITAGWFEEFDSTYTFHIWLIKTDSYGDTLWTKTYDDGMASSVQQTANGGYIIVGEKIPFYMVGYTWLLKTDCHGDTLWTKTFSLYNINVGHSVQQTADGGFVLAGGSYDMWLPFSDFQIIRTDSIGSTLWTKNLYDSYGYDVQLTTDGGYIAVGYIYRDYWWTNSDLLLIKTQPDPVLFIDPKPVFISDYELHQNYPNPFNPSTTIEFILPKTSEVTLKVFNILGEEVETLVSDRLSAGSYSYEWDASNSASGVYLYRLQAGEYIETKKMILMR